jgi:hypothetical protein
MRSGETRIASAGLLWLVGGTTLALGLSLWHWRVRWERENVVTTPGVYDGGCAGLFDYVYVDESGEVHRQGFPILFPPEGSRFEVQYDRSDPANGWVKRSGPSGPLLLLYGVNVVAVLLLLGGTWLAMGAHPSFRLADEARRTRCHPAAGAGQPVQPFATLPP